jgi:tRNA pseudouridine65 synthase
LIKEESVLIDLKIIYEDDHLVAINKPHGLLVHKSRIASDAKQFALQLVRNYCGHYVYPVHRLDRKTSGVLLFAKSSEIASLVQQQFKEKTISKQYLALVRGFTPERGKIDYCIGEKENKKNAITEYYTLKRYEIEYASHYHPTSRYSLVQIHPLTGRFHQIRKHMAHIHHPIIGDRPHGCNKQNRFWKDTFGVEIMLLHASKLTLKDLRGNLIKVDAPKSEMFSSVLQKLSTLSVVDSPI